MRVDDFAAFFATAWPRLYRTALAIAGDPGAAEDALQSAFIKAYAGWPRVARPTTVIADHVDRVAPPPGDLAGVLRGGGRLRRRRRAFSARALDFLDTDAAATPAGVVYDEAGRCCSTTTAGSPR